MTFARALQLIAVTGALFTTGASALATIHLELRPSSPTIAPGEPLELGLYAVADGNTPQLMGAADILFQWNPAVLRLDGLTQAGATSLLLSFFPLTDPWGNINGGHSPPTGGTGFYEAYANLGAPASIQPTGTLLTTFRLTALAAAPNTVVAIIPSAGNNGHTVVYDGTVPNLPVTGTLGSATIRIGAACAPADANCDGVVNNFDIDGFVAGLLFRDEGSAPGVYLATGAAQQCWEDRGCWGDVNGDQAFNNFDIDPFVLCILEVGCPQ